MKVKWGCEGDTLPGWGILACGVWVRSWDHVPNPQKPVHLPVATQRVKERTVQKLKCFWCSQHPGRAGAGHAAHAGRGCCRAPPPSQDHSAPASLPSGRDSGEGGALFLLHH